MCGMLFFVLLGLRTIIVYAIFKYYQYVARYPQGPFPLPFLGNIHQVDLNSPQRTNQEIGQRQIGIYTLFMPYPCVQITDYGMLREAFVDKGRFFADRPENGIVQEMRAYAPNTGLFNANGEGWRENRRAVMSIMRDLARNNALEEIVNSSVAHYLAHLESVADKDHLMTANVVNDLLFGFRYRYDDCRPMMDYIDGCNELLKSMADSMGVAVALILPVLRHLPLIGWHCVGKYRAAQAELNEYVFANAEKCLAGVNMQDEPTTFVHAYARLIGSSEHVSYENLLATCADLFVGGTETTTATLQWAMLLLAENQSAQERLREEILRVVGKGRLPTAEDQIKMPYARACVLEVQRRANILQSNIQRVTVEDVTIRGQKIPKGTWVNGDIHYIMANDPLFDDPDEFRPERYLRDVGNTTRKASFSWNFPWFLRHHVERTLPFSIGERDCAGKSIARIELFVAITATFQNYRITSCPGEEIDLECAPSAILVPRDQTLRIQRI